MELTGRKWTENGKHCKMVYLPEIETVFEKWEGFTYGEELRESWKNAHEFFKQNKAKKVLLDLTNSKAIPMKDTIWYFKELFPLTYNLGFKSLALIESKDPINRLSVKNAYNSYEDTPVNISFFKDTSDALEWLKNN